MKINTYLLNLIEQILVAMVLEQTHEIARLKTLAIDDIVENSDLKTMPGFSGKARGVAATRLTAILKPFILEE